MKIRRGNKLFVVALLAIVVLLAPPKVFAACSVSTTALTFAPYDFLDAAATTGTGSITLSCAPTALFVNVAIGVSTNSGGFFPRQMKHSTFIDTIDYNIYTDVAATQVWGDNTSGTATRFFFNVKNNNTPPITLYGRISPLQNVPAGNYSEQLIVTITY